MKTLDEVIEAVENCYCLTEPIKGCDECPYYGECNKLGDPYRDDVLEYLKKYRERKTNYEEARDRHYAAAEILEKRISEPERKKGEWIDGKPYVNSHWRVCSICHETSPDGSGNYNFCPHCGADMRI